MAINLGYCFGLEQECFLTKEGEFVVPSRKYPRDNAGYLVEARGDPFSSPTEAVFSLAAQKYKIKRMTDTDGLTCSFEPKVKLPIRVVTDAWKAYGLPTKDKVISNLYGESLTDEQLEYQYAGTHINISKIKMVKGGEKVTEAFDFVPVVKWLDERFKTEIEAAGRLRGGYAIKELIGGVGLEYRSLPCNISDVALIEALEEAKTILND